MNEKAISPDLSASSDGIRARISSGEPIFYDELIKSLDETNPDAARELKKLRLIEEARVSARSRLPSDSDLNEQSPEIPDFSLRREIGAGAFGTVWLAQNIHDERFYAVKVLRDGRERDLDLSLIHI